MKSKQSTKAAPKTTGNSLDSYFTKFCKNHPAEARNFIEDFTTFFGLGIQHFPRQGSGPMTPAESDVFLMEFGAFYASSSSAARAKTAYEKAVILDRLDPVFKAAAKRHADASHEGVLSLISVSRIIGVQPKLNTEGMRWSIEQALAKEDNQFFARLGRALTEKPRLKPDWLSVFLFMAWVEIPQWRKGDKRFPGLMILNDEDIGRVFNLCLPSAIKNEVANDKRKGELASPRAVAARIKRLGLIRYPFMAGELRHSSKEGGPVGIELSPIQPIF